MVFSTINHPYHPLIDDIDGVGQKTTKQLRYTQATPPRWSRRSRVGLDQWPPSLSGRARRMWSCWETASGQAAETGDSLWFMVIYHCWNGVMALGTKILFDKAPGIFMGSWMIMGYYILPSSNLTVCYGKWGNWFNDLALWPTDCPWLC